MNSRRLTRTPPNLDHNILWDRTSPNQRMYVRFGSKADICSAKRNVRFTPESGHSTLQHVLETLDGKTGSHRALRARADSRRGRRGRPVFQEPVLGTADGGRRNSPGVRGVLSEVPEALMSAGRGVRKRPVVRGATARNPRWEVLTGLDPQHRLAEAIARRLYRQISRLLK